MKNIIYILFFSLFLLSCQLKFNGKSIEQFDISKKEIEKQLDSEEKVRLEKALIVISIEAMKLKWEEPNRYKGKSFDEISLEMLNGKTYSSTLVLAEKLLEQRQLKEIDQLTKEYDSLVLEYNELKVVQERMKLFKVAYCNLCKIDFFGKESFRLTVGLEYVGEEELQGEINLLYEVRQKSKNELIQSITMGGGDENSIRSKGYTIETSLIISQTKQDNPELWKVNEHAILDVNLSDYDLMLDVSLESSDMNGLKIRDIKIKESELVLEIKNTEEKLVKLKNSTRTLDEIEF